MHFLAFSVVFLLPVVVVLGYLGGGVLNFLAIFVAFGMVPLTDLLLGRFKDNPSEEEEKQLSNAFRYKFWLYLAVPAQIALMFWGAWVASTRSLTSLEWVGLTLSIGITGGVMGINIAHELIHRLNRFETGLGNALLWTVGYMHWSIGHVAGHHRRVATPEDPATARLGEWFYIFWPRTVFGGFLSAWRIESERLKRRRRRVWGVHNRIIHYTMLTAALVSGLAVGLGPVAVGFFFFQSLVAISLLEVVNYVEHYGLLRRKTADGRYERVSPVHSWNAAELMTNLFLFNLQRHSDHHAEPRRPYPMLRHHEDAPQLPTGYAGMVLLALVPPLWFWIMNRRVPETMKALASDDAGPVSTPS